MLVAKWFKSKKILINSFGQVSIFFSTTIVVMITLIAFVINIGVFVKAKINLQNATDAAAYAGASVQARQLTNISYMNWEMRNIYKEWMFKYYVLGGLNLQGVISPGPDRVDFTMSSSFTGSPNEAFDQHNFPSVCIDFANTGSVGLCTKYVVPGLPRFKSENVLGMDEVTNSFIDAIVSEKAKNCSDRSNINFLTANTWAYNVTDTDPAMVNLNSKAPQIVRDRPGAFPAAFEVALRIRNLEAQVNTPPKSGVCFDPTSGVSCFEGIENIVSTNSSPSQERVYKAFYSGFRNLGSDTNTLMRRSFTITELAPVPNDPQLNQSFSLSRLLIPEGKGKKYYLDLQLNTINYATFYTAFTSNQGEADTSVGTTATEAQCTATKVGLPVPGYPLGFVKNHKHLTYYAIKAQSKFNGLFNPFDDTVTLTAYAAAKPFGGRIGPPLFDTSDGNNLKARTGVIRKSIPYISGFKSGVPRRDQYGNPIPGGDVESFVPGSPIPFNTPTSKFFVEREDSSVGGWNSASGIFFGIPNLVFDYPVSGQIDGASTFQNADDAVQLITYKPKGGPSLEKAGLYNSQMFQKFSSKLTNLGGVVNTDNIRQAIIMSRSPTEYDAHNYLIPTPEKVNKTIGTDSFGTIYTDPIDNYVDANGKSHEIYNYSLYAPLYVSADAPDALFTTASDIRSVLEQYINTQRIAIEKYIGSMNLAAQSIYNTNTSGATGENAGIQAARIISDIPELAIPTATRAEIMAGVPSCASMAGKFAAFYLGPSSVSSSLNCPTALTDLLIARWSGTFNAGASLTSQYTTTFSLPNEDILDTSNLFSAFRPGEEHDAPGNNGIQRNEINKKQFTKIRNFYSTKFIPLKSISSSTSALFRTPGAPILSEGSDAEGEFSRNIRNPIEVNTEGIDLNLIKH